MLPDLITRAEAKKRGSKLYFTGEPCRHGHVTTRRVDNKSCSECGRLKSLPRVTAWYASNRDRKRAYDAAYRAKNAERKRANDAAWRAANVERKRANDAAWAAANPERARVNKRAACTRRRASMYAARCACCTSEDFARIYGAANGRQVDHVVPMADGGKHCVRNLQYLTKVEHSAKTAIENSRRAESRRETRKAHTELHL